MEIKLTFSICPHVKRVATKINATMCGRKLSSSLEPIHSQFKSNSQLKAVSFYFVKPSVAGHEISTNIEHTVNAFIVNCPARWTMPHITYLSGTQVVCACWRTRASAWCCLDTQKAYVPNGSGPIALHRKFDWRNRVTRPVFDWWLCVG